MFKNIALITVPSHEIERPPAALAALGGVCASMNINYTTFDINLMSFDQQSHEQYQQSELYWRVNDALTLPDSMIEIMDDVIEQLCAQKFDMIAVSVFSKFSTRAARLFLSRLSMLKRAMIVAGGQGLRTRYDQSDFGQFLLQSGLVHHVGYGDGEVLFKNWLIGNFRYPGTDSIPPQQIDDLESLPLPDFSQIDPNRYHYNRTPGIYITASRGCVRSCKFCDVPWRWPKYRYRKGVTVANELYHHFQTTGVTTFQFTDSVVNGNLKEFLAMQTRLADLRKQDPGFDVRWLSQFNIRKKKDMPEIFYSTMRQAGAEVLVCGAEHASWPVRKHMGKEFDNDDLDYHIKMCARHGIKNVFLMFIGYPTETLADHQEMIEFLTKYQKYMLSGTIMMIRWGYTGSMDHGSRLDTRKDIFDIVPEWPDLDPVHLDDHNQDWLYGRNWINLNNPGLTLRERLRRRLEIQEESFRLGWPVTRSLEELEILHIIADQLLGEKKTIPINIEESDH